MGFFSILFLSYQHPTQAYLTALVPFIWSAFKQFVWHKTEKNDTQFNRIVEYDLQNEFATFETKKWNNAPTLERKETQTPEQTKWKIILQETVDI